MKYPKSIFSSIGLSIVLFLTASPLFADSTSVLPKGRNALTLGVLHGIVDREFDDNSSNRELGYFLNGVDVTEIGEPVIQAALAAQGVVLPPGVNALDYAGTTLKSDVTVDMTLFNFSHGLTDDLTLSVSFPYFNRAETDINFDVVVQANPMLSGIPAGPGYSLADVINGTDGVALAQNFLNSNIGYDPVEPWTGDPGVGDIDIDLKYRFLNGDKFKAAAGGWITLPTGEPDDEMSLTDIRYGGGSLNNAVYAMVDIVPVKPVTWNITGRYVYTHPYHRGIFALDKDTPQFYDIEFATLHEFGDFDSGDWYELETALSYEMVPGINVFTSYLYTQSDDDRLDGDILPKTIIMEKRLTAGLTASTVDYYLKDKAEAPLIFNLLFQQTQDGRNTTLFNRAIFTTTLIF